MIIRRVDGFGGAERMGQRDRELEELLCLAYLFTHSFVDESSDEVEFPLVDDTELMANYFCN